MVVVNGVEAEKMAETVARTMNTSISTLTIGMVNIIGEVGMVMDGMDMVMTMIIIVIVAKLLSKFQLSAQWYVLSPLLPANQIQNT